MAFQPVPDTAEAVCRSSMNGVIVTNTFYFRRVGGYTQQQLQELADEVDEWYGTQAIVTMSSSLNYIETVVRGLANENDIEVTANANAGLGSNSGTPLPNNVSFAVARVSGLTGRSARGRVYWPGLTVSNLSPNENEVTLGYQAGVETVLNALRFLIEVLGWIEVIVSRYAEGQKRAVAVTFPVLGYVSRDVRVDSQRARLI